MPNNLDRGSAEHMILLIAQCLTGRNDDAIPGMNAKGVEVLHVADSDAVILAISHHLVLHLFPAFQRLLDQDLRRERQ